MKKIMFVSMVVFIFSVSLYAAGSKTAQTSNVWQGEQIPVIEETLDKISQTGGVFELPCMMYDKDDFFACTGIHQGHRNQNKEEVKAFALASAIDECSHKMGHVIKGLVIDYHQKYGGDKNYSCMEESDINFPAIINVAQVSCVKYSVEKGIVTAYVGIKVPKKELSKKVKELEKIGMYPEKNPTNVKNEKKVPDDEAISEEEKQMIEMIEKRLKEAEETDKTEQSKKK